MKVVVYLLGFLWIAAGAMAILYTEDYKVLFNGLLIRLERIWLAAIPAVVGLLLLFAAASTTHAWFIGTLGVLGIAKGVLVYSDPGEIFETARDWMKSMSDQGYRLVGILALVLGTVVISWIR